MNEDGQAQIQPRHPTTNNAAGLQFLDTPPTGRRRQPCLLHGIFPFLFGRTGSNAITALNWRMMTRRVGGKAPLPGVGMSLDSALDR